MPEVINIEYRNQNSLRRYPFEDEATMLDTTGVALPIDFLVDAFMYPIDLKGRVYISSIDLGAGRIHFTDTGTRKECGFADFTNASTTAEIYDNETFMRQIGLLVFGDGIAGVFQGYGVRTFTVSGTAFCPTTYIPMTQIGVRAIILPDGTIMTGDVVIEGQNGITVETYTSGTKDVIYIDIVGIAVGDQQCDCGDCCPITTIRAERVPGSLFMISQYDSRTIGISAYNFDLGDVCSKQRAQQLPDSDGNLPRHPKAGDDPCGETPLPPHPPALGPSVSFDLVVASASGNIGIIAPSAGDFNAAYVLDCPGSNMQGQAKLSTQPAYNLADVAKAMADFGNPPTFTDAIEIGIKGLAQYRRGTR